MGDYAINLATSPNLPSNWQQPWYWSSTMKITPAADAGLTMYWVCGNLAGGITVPTLKFIFAAGALAANHISTIRWRDPTGGNIDATNVPFTMNVDHDIDIEFDGVNIKVEIDDVLVLTAAANCSSAAPNACVLECLCNDTDVVTTDAMEVATL